MWGGKKEFACVENQEGKKEKARALQDYWMEKRDLN